MWIREALVDSPRGAWFAIALGWARTVLLALAAVGIGATLDAWLTSEAWLAPALLTVAAAIIGSLAGLAAETLPGRLQGEEEISWRQRVLRRAILGGSGSGSGGKAPTSSGHELRAEPAGHPDHSKSASQAGHAKPGGRGGHAKPGGHGHGHGHGQPASASGEGALVDAATTGVEKTANYRASFLGPTLASFTAPLFVLVVWAVFIDLVSAIILTVFVALVPVVIVYVGKWLRKPNHEYRRKETAAADQYLEMLEGIGTMKVLGAAPAARDRFAEAARAAMRELGTLLGRNQLMIIVNDGVFGLLMSGAAVILVLAGLAGGSLSAGAAFAALLLTVLLYEPIDRVGRTFYVGIAGRTRRDQLETLVADTRVEPDAPTTDRQPPNQPVDIELRNLSVTIRGNRILREVNLRIPAGARVALVGPSGAGKTTLMRAIAGLTGSQTGATVEGEILVNGKPASSAELRSLVTSVAQQPGILSTTVADNLRLVADDASEDDLSEALVRAHLLEEVQAMPGKLDAQVGDRGTFLSGGQRRRVAIARAFLRERPVLLLDEPTADLDRRTEALVRESLAEITAGRTVLQIAHRLDTTLDVDLVAVVSHGRVIATGTPDELRAKDGYYATALAQDAPQGTAKEVPLRRSEDAPQSAAQDAPQSAAQDAPQNTSRQTTEGTAQDSPQDEEGDR
ncbi:ATP-binding cassette domain-containing protein [Gulosibacter chungangensis]|uniref:ATP-binding cassette domain-containing protein n=1 Tax=Gulosibacter chungangensis TaxID=979746 RepID=A0A7J5B7Z4_9MICO|nr:ATP-binding cassette domain-containing protein [Gulosibacter chungangensis]KAB1641199.1 ATP-binding cassette domain-containing protein [Gulosibacter chungangensis]